eukprot:gnl/TRDRNA2_/TRDRNA2_173158_c0_seq3.p1 gnl/TRDRNA2_/TRDRNA2_173158_c0~~gnl/TRDRNA2_/TRDRNA2_173158_c0_seq3.p1  ORF type:complete len:374 (-),score=72.03 gnl/TRDRNA2_/TRDRNA2_173158_c0_seq3:591-1565(-)
MTGFASIQSWSRIQQHPLFSQSPIASLCILPLCFVGTNLLFQAFDVVRDRISGSDGVVDKSEEMWDAEAEEAENDVIGLSISFTTTQALRYAILGVLPDEEGVESDAAHAQSSREAAWLFGSIPVWALLILLAVKAASYGAHQYGLHSKARRMAGIFLNIFSMNLAWCLLFGGRALLVYLIPGSSPELITSKTALALGLSAFSFAIIFALDKVADRQSEKATSANKSDKKAIIKIITSLGLLIGFSWEQCFDAAIDSMTEMFMHPHIAGLVISACLCAIVIPAYWMYILPSLLEYKEAEEEEEEKEAEEGGTDYVKMEEEPRRA